MHTPKDPTPLMMTLGPRKPRLDEQAKPTPPLEVVNAKEGIYRDASGKLHTQRPMPGPRIPVPAPEVKPNKWLMAIAAMDALRLTRMEKIANPYRSEDEERQQAAMQAPRQSGKSGISKLFYAQQEAEHNARMANHRMRAAMEAVSLSIRPQYVFVDEGMGRNDRRVVVQANANANKAAP